MSAITQLASTLSSGINDVQSQIADVQNQLATGKRNLNPAESGQVTRLSAQVTGYNQVDKNIGQGQNVISVSQTALTSINEIMNQMQQIANQASSGNLSPSDQASLNQTFQQLLQQATSLSSSASLNGVNILDGNTLNVTTDISGATTTINNQAITGGALSVVGGYATDSTGSVIGKLTSYVAGPPVSTLNVSNATAAQAALTAINTASSSISTAQSNLAAASVGLAANATTSQSMSSNLQKTIDSIQSVDQAAMQAKLQQLNNQQSIDYYLISQMDTAASAVLSIFR